MARNSNIAYRKGVLRVLPVEADVEALACNWRVQVCFTIGILLDEWLFHQYFLEETDNLIKKTVKLKE